MRKDGTGAADIDKGGAQGRAEYGALPRPRTLEPVNCTAEIINGECHITGPIPVPAGRKCGVAAGIGMPPKRSSFTPRSSAVATAASLSSTSDSGSANRQGSRQASEDDLDARRRHDARFLSSLSLHQMTAGLDASGNVTTFYSKDDFRRRSLPARSAGGAEQQGSVHGRRLGESHLQDPEPRSKTSFTIPASAGYWRSVSNAQRLRRGELC